MPSPLDIVLPIRIQRIEKSDVAPEAGAAGTHDRGFSAGYEAGRLRAEWEGGRQREKDNARVQALVQKLENLHREFETLVGEHLPDLIHGALQRVFRKNPFTIEQVGEEIGLLLRDMEQAGRIALECAPEEMETLRTQLEHADAIGGSKWTLHANPRLKAGEFLLKSDLGDVDGRHSSRIRQIHLALGGDK